MFDIFDDLASDVAVSDFLDAEARRSVNLENEGAASAAHEIDTSDMEAHGTGGTDGNLLFFIGELDGSTFAAFVEVGAEIIVERLTTHAGDDFRPDDKSADVGAGGFGDIFLEEDVGAVFIIKVKRLKGGFGGFLRVGENDAVAVSAGS